MSDWEKDIICYFKDKKAYVEYYGYITTLPLPYNINRWFIYSEVVYYLTFWGGSCNGLVNFILAIEPIVEIIEEKIVGYNKPPVI